ncbi:MAG: hypothetical protein ABIG44_13305 [Planctomycetota bacterium]
MRHLILLAVTAILLATPAPAGIMRHDLPWSDYETYGQTDPKFGASLWVGVWHSDGTHRYGTMTAIASGSPDSFWGVSAAHVFEGLDGYGGDITDMKVRYGTNGLTNYSVEVDVIQFVLHPEWDPQYAEWNTTDLVLVEFEIIPDVTPIGRFIEFVQRDTFLNMGGYGTPGYPDTGPDVYDGEKRGGDNILYKYGGDLGYSQIDSSYMMLDFGLVDVQPLEYHVWLGDSGSGWLLDGAGEWQLAGVTSFWWGGFDNGSSSGVLSLYEFNSWIDTILAAAGIPGECEDADLDADSDCDLADFAAFQQAFTGPGRAVRSGGGKLHWTNCEPMKHRRELYKFP